jgi:2-oxoglutarate ferredoxin oxidoreductase subunit beta
VYNNMVYGLTKGQASPTTPRGVRTAIHVDGVTSAPFNPLATALVQGATFVARAFAGDVEGTKEIIKRAMTHRGYALVDIFQPCVSFNHVQTYRWFRENTYVLEGHDEGDFRRAMDLALTEGPFPLGVLYRREGVPTFEDGLAAYRDDDRPLFRREAPRDAVRRLMAAMCT